MELQDPLKPLNDVVSPDRRYLGTGPSLEAIHAELETLQVHVGVPLHVRQMFETAKNLSLYAWFVYRFHPVARQLAYVTLERALKERHALEVGDDPETITKTLGPLMAMAVRTGWIKSERYSSVLRIARVRLNDDQNMRMILSGELRDKPVEIPKISDAEVFEYAATMDFVNKIASSIPEVRNHLAHGGKLLDSGSPATLRVVAETINQLFKDPTGE
jgi:hypothetical protein